MQFTDSKSQQQSPFVAFLATTVLVSSKGNFCQSEDAKEDIVCLPVLVLARL